MQQKEILLSNWNFNEYRETKIKIGEGEGTNTKLIFNPEGGNVLIGKISQNNSTYKLDVNGSIRSNEIVVNTTGADFVFAEDYALPSLDSIHQYIKANKHLPEIASAKEMQTNGINLSEMNIKLLQKVEELTLYMIEQNKNMHILQEENICLEKRLNLLEQKNK
nr:hypothetical protein [uncultured Flavobacterium sp.]